MFGRRSFLIIAAALGAAGLTGCTLSSPKDPVPDPPLAKAWSTYLADPDKAPFVDFSAAGAYYSERGIGEAGGAVFNVSDFGAVVDDQGDDTQAIQAAIDAAEANGGGIVQFDSGTYRINETPTPGGIRVSNSGIVLRGSATGTTRLHMVQPMPLARPGAKWSGPAMIQFRPAGEAAPSSRHWPEEGRIAVTSDQVTGGLSREVADASGFSAGDYLSLEMKSVEAAERFLEGKTPRDIWERVRTEGVMVREKHEIERVEGNTLVLKQPLLVDVDTRFGWYVRPLNLIEHVGFENICVVGSFDEPFAHHKNAVHDSGFRAVELTRTAHSWVRNSCFADVTTAVTLRGGVANTVMLNKIEGNGGHFSFHTEFGTRNLLALNLDWTDNGQFHGPGASHMSAGTVFWRFDSPTSPGLDVHGTFPRHTHCLMV